MAQKKGQNPISELTRTLGGDLIWLRILVYVGFALIVVFLVVLLWLYL
ncbi:MAG: hypothetical protein ACP5FL_09120 [Thermoplasmatota archaeon]